MADYTKMKNAELENLLKERGLPHSGKKAELVKRLQDHDSQDTGSTAAAAAAPAKNEDEIDWDDDAEATTATTEPAAAAIAAGGQGQPLNPQAVPNQEAAIDPAETKDLTVSEPPSESQPATEEAPAAEPAKPEVDFSAGIAKTTLEQEIEKRKARAKKFGIDESADETLKTLERAKRFGGTDLPGRLNEALPERREKKRGREVPEDATARKRTRPGPGGRRDGGRRNPGKAPTEKSGGGNGTWMSESDKAKAEARKAKFASTS